MNKKYISNKMVYPSDLWEYCTSDYFGIYELTDDLTFISQICDKLRAKFHEKHIHSGQIPMICYFGGVCEFCDNYNPSDKEIITEACRMPTFATYFNEFKENFIRVNIFFKNMTRCGSGLEEYQNVLYPKMNSKQVIYHVLAKIRETY